MAVVDYGSRSDFKVMGTTIPAFRIALKWKKAEWKKPFRNALGKSDREKFNELFGIPRFYASPCS